MPRRSHKKSRNGCLTCKQRHVKCDEGLPICSLCTLSARECRYPSEPRKRPNRPVQPAVHKTNSRRNSSLPAKATSLSPFRASDTSLPEILNPSEDEEVNMLHMELLIHLTADGFDLLGGANATSRADHAYTVRRGLRAPFLLCQLLALSARHLSLERPSRSSYYFKHALILQTRAVSLFNAANHGPHGPNGVDAMLYSSKLSHHHIADMCRTPGDLDAFVAAFTHGILKGVPLFSLRYWPELMESELRERVMHCATFTRTEPKGGECQVLYDAFENSGSLPSEEREALVPMIKYLQIGFDALSSSEWDRHQMIHAWPALGSETFLDMVGNKEPEALVLMAWYAVLLHHGRSMWQVGDAGAHILHLISSHLNGTWKFALEYPKHVILGGEG